MKEQAFDRSDSLSTGERLFGNIPPPPEGNLLSQTETTEINDITERPEQGVETDEHTHEHTDGDHGHHHHAPALNPELKREIEVETSADEVSKSFRAVIKRYAKLARIPGFRSGKVPDSLIRSKFAKEIRQEVLESLVSERFRRAINEQQLRPVSEPQLLDLQLMDGQPLRFKAAFEVMPQIDLTGYDSVKVRRPETTLTNDEFEAELNRCSRGSCHGGAGRRRSAARGRRLGRDLLHRPGERARADRRPKRGSKTQRQASPSPGEDVLIEIGGKNTLPAFNETPSAAPGPDRS